MTLALESEILERSTLLTDLHWSLENLCCRENVTWRNDIWTTICQTKHLLKVLFSVNLIKLQKLF